MTRPLSPITRRAAVAGLTASAAFGQAARAAPAFDAVVGQGGLGSVGAAIAEAPADGTKPFRILIGKGRWYEKLTVDKPHVHLIGEDRKATVLDFDAASGTKGPDGRAYGTSRTGSVQIAAPDCVVKTLTATNSFDYLRARREPEFAATVSGQLQALAFSTIGKADRTLIEDVDMTSWQDTLFPNSGRALFRNCFVSGAVDFIFGAGTAYFDRCTIECRGRPDMTAGRQGYVTAPSTDASNPYGLIFDRCRLTKQAGLKAGVFALGRPWRAGNVNAVGESVFLRCWMDDHIDPTGWDRMAYGRDGAGEYLWFNPEQARFYEFQSSGPGGKVSDKRRQLTADQARFFDRDRVLRGWKA